LILLITILFIISAVTPLVIGFAAVSGQDEYLGDLAFVCSYDNSNSKLDYYKEHFLPVADSNDDFVVNVIESEDVAEKIPSISPLLFSGPMDSAWPMQSYDTHHTGRSPYSTIDTTSAEKWRFKPDEGAVGETPVIDSDGTIYCGYTKLHAINPTNGSVKWTFDVGGTMRGGTPCNSIDGIIYLGTHIGSFDDGEIIAIHPDGSLKFRKRIKTVESPPAIGEDGTVYIGSFGGDTKGFHSMLGRYNSRR